MSDTRERERDADGQSTTQSLPTICRPEYRNSLLAAVGYLDLANALDFPANVWNDDPLPLVAMVLMGLGGSIAILTTYFAFWDMSRSWQNVKVLLKEREYLKKRCSNEKRLPAMEDAWLAINYRELGWEIVDRILMDAFMAIAGILVGTGCLMAIRGDIPAVFTASNDLSGYVGNSFVAVYAVVNAVWSVYMWRKAHINEMAITKHQGEIDGYVLMRLRKHARRHKIYAFINGLSVLVSGIASEVSSTLWQGYCVLIPCIAGSIFCNYFWRYCLGYNILLFGSRGATAGSDIYSRLRLLVDLHRAVTEDPEASLGIDDAVATLVEDKQFFVVDGLLNDLGVSPVARTRLTANGETSVTGETNEMCSTTEKVQVSGLCIRSIDKVRFRDEERFLLELYGYYLAQAEALSPQKKTTE